jgi:hypothetical protein
VTPRRGAALLSALLAGAAALAFAPGAQAQQVRPAIDVIGSVGDAQSDLPMASVPVRMIPVPQLDDDGVAIEEERPRSIRETVAGPDGRFTFPAVIPGRYLLQVSAFGYAPIEQEMSIRGASPFEIRVGLVPEALTLAPVVVTSVRSPRLSTAGFYERRTRGLGNFMDRNQIEERLALRTSDLFNYFPGVQVRPARMGSGGVLTIRGGCRPDLVLDGLNLGPEVLVDDVVTPSDVEAIEVYRGAASPIEYSRSNCGSVMLWTADPATREDGAPFSFKRIFAAVGFVIGALLLF